MAIGQVFFFDQFIEDESHKLHDLSNDTLMLGLITSVATPTKATADPRWGAGATNLSTNEVTAGGSYVAGGVSLSGTITNNLTRVGSTKTLTGDDVSIAQNSLNPTDARWGIIYNATDAGKRCIAYVDLGGVVNLTSGPFSITWSGTNVIATQTTNP